MCPQNLCPGGSGEPSGALAELIKRDFGSQEAMQAKLSASTVAVQVGCRGRGRVCHSFTHEACCLQGSGWGWLGYNKEAGKLAIATCANQDPLQVQPDMLILNRRDCNLRPPPAWSPCLASTSGSTRTTSSIRTLGQITSRQFSR